MKYSSKRHRSPRPDTLKCIQIKLGGEILRVSADEASAQVSAGTAHYVTKSKWKAQRK
jgi:hypothetical protein